MKSMTVLLMLLLGTMLWGTEAHAQYNLRTIPATPSAGVPFLAAFDGNTCEVFILTAPAQPPVVSVQGTTVRLEVDHLVLANCIAQPETHTLNVPALATGSYQLELINRAFQSPGNDSLAQTVSFQVGPAIAAAPTSIPTAKWFGLLALAGALFGFGYAMSRRDT
jgi:hypothetical protein